MFADPAPEQLQRIEQAHEVLDGLSENMLGYYLSRGRLDLRKKGRLDPDPDELVLAAAAAVRRRTA